MLESKLTFFNIGEERFKIDMYPERIVSPVIKKSLYERATV